ncbi:DEAD/DEAH box helicase [Halorussus ruber]|uniref:DEAD/DEAH box helicase n=1 Tax=Halorussus ruber TaxID=1126238 RepID=UPI001092F335|nr:DEAD/DEAH box helicase [Halorussus ruber]
MPSDGPTTYESAANSDLFRNCLEQLAVERLFTDLGLDRNVTVDDSRLRRAAWIASLLANSDDETHRQLAVSFAILAYHHADSERNEELYRNYLFTVMSRLGNVPVVQSYFGDGSETAVASGPSGPNDPEDGIPETLKYELEGTEAHYSVGTNNTATGGVDDLVLTRFQKDVWDELVTGRDTAFSGPTSSGKSFLVRKYIEYLATTCTEFCGLYLVPSRALIAEVSAELGGDLPDSVQVRTEVVNPSELDETAVYVLTPERTLSLLESADDVDLDFCFMDEIQSVEKSQRGPLFEFVLDSIINVWPDAQVVGAGPFVENVASPIENAKTYLDDEPSEDSDVEEVVTTYSPVYRLQSEFTFEPRSNELRLTVGDQTSFETEKQIERPNDVKFSTVKGNKSETVRAFAELYRMGDPLLVYAETVTRAENLAERIAGDREKDTTRFPELVSFLREELTESYPLIKCLQAGVAYHHGGVPPFARSEIESLYRNGEIDTIVSTTTLLEGVNLPAGKILVVDHTVGGEKGEELSQFQLQNLVGRVGRVGERLHGEVLYVDHKDDRWANDQISGIARKQIKPTTTEILGTRTEAVVNLLNFPLHRVAPGSKRSTAVFLKSRYLIDSDQTERFVLWRLKQSEESDVEEYFKRIRSGLQELQERIDVPVTVVEQNPAVDPDIANNLYTEVCADPSGWVVHPERIAKDLSDLVERLDEVAALVPEGRWEDQAKTKWISDTSTLADLATGWLQEKDYKTLVTISGLDDISKLLRALRQDVRYVLSKYFKVVGDILAHVDTGGVASEAVEFTKRLNLYFEHGTSSEATLQLMNLGLSRSVALRLSLPIELPTRSRIERYLADSDEPLNPFVEQRINRHGIGE